MNIDDAFPSRWVRVEDLQGREITAFINTVEVQQLDSADPTSLKPVIYFKGSEKGLGLNKTNAETIKAALGSETDEWIGLPLTLYASSTLYQGKQVACIRVRVPDEAKQKLAERRTARAAAPAGTQAPSPVDDDLPF